MEHISAMSIKAAESCTSQKHSTTFKILQQFLNYTKLILCFLQLSFQNSFSKSDTGMVM